jgi:hypothetical protein
MGPLDGGLHGPEGKCPGHLGQVHHAPKGPAGQAQGETLGQMF